MTISAPAFQYWPRASKGFLPPAMSFQRLATTAYVVGPTGLLTPVNANVPRLYYDPFIIGSAQGTLIEQASTNICLQSAFAASWAAGDTTIATNVGPDQLGTTTAASIVEDSSNTSHYAQQFVTFANSTTYTFSVYVVPNGRQYVGMYFPTATFATSGRAALFNLSGSGSVLAVDSGVAANIQTGYAGGYLISITATSNAAASGNAVIWLGSASSSSTAIQTYTGNGTSGIYAWGAQIEAANQPTSRIPTATVSLSRSADALSIPLASIPGYNPLQGSLMVSGWTPLTSANAPYFATLDTNGSTADRLGIYQSSGGSIWAAYNNVADTFHQVAGGAGGNGNYFAAAISWISGTLTVSLNGGATASTSIAGIQSFTYLRIGTYSGYTTVCNSAISRVALYSRALTGADLQAIAA